MKKTTLLIKAARYRMHGWYWWLAALALVPVEALFVFFAERTGPLWRHIQYKYDNRHN